MDREGDAVKLNQARANRDAKLGMVLNPFSDLNTLLIASRAARTVDNTRAQRITQPKVQVKQAQEVQPSSA